MQIKIATTQKDFADVFRIRTNVFIGEQQVPPHEEIDDLDGYVPILVAYTAENQAVGTARIILKEDNIAKIGRVAVDKNYRRAGVGKKLMEASINYVNTQTDATIIKLDAQVTAIPFYLSLGFTPYGDEFLDAGIRHVAMKYVLNSK
ncbi:MAG TPA: GNAT family N-acetyltransferase [Firmicutes bacterium]|nr:GNAT family N-acetyltransferase [Bacillota bacterium]